MKGLKILVIVALVFLFAGQAALVADVSSTDISLGEKLERQIWADMKALNMEAIEGKIATGFQSVHEDGARGRDAEIKLLKGLKLGKYELSKFEVTQNGPVIVVTYFLSVEETIGGKRLPTAPAARQSVWMKTDGKWQWIAHANLNPMGK